MRRTALILSGRKALARTPYTGKRRSMAMKDAMDCSVADDTPISPCFVSLDGWQQACILSMIANSERH